jgi:glycerate kinase
MLHIAKIVDTHLLFDLNEINYHVVCDVKTHCSGDGAAYVYRVKGNQIQLLDMGLRHFNDQVQQNKKK